MEVSTLSEDIEMVANLDIPIYDENRQFPGIVKQKRQRKDKHNKAIEDHALFLNEISDQLEKDVLNYSRLMKERLEQIDLSIDDNLKILSKDENLANFQEKDLFQNLDAMNNLIDNRRSILTTFHEDLDQLEKKRTDIVGARINSLLSNLIDIAHQLPNEIERVIESETSDLNMVTIQNRKSHMDLMSLLYKYHAEKDVLSHQSWENYRQKWRHLKHHNAVKIFLGDIHSDFYGNPSDRFEFVASVRYAQQLRQNERNELIEQLMKLSASDLNTERIDSIRSKFSIISENETVAMQECYNHLNSLRSRADERAKHRVEDFRKELHLYGFLHDEPNLHNVIAYLNLVLVDPNYEQLFRLGGGLKPELLEIISSLSSEDVVYDNHIQYVMEKFDFISSGFGLKLIMEKSGRLALLERLRSHIIKLRTIPRNESINLVQSLVSELPELLEINDFKFQSYSVTDSSIAPDIIALNRANEIISSDPKAIVIQSNSNESFTKSIKSCIDEMKIEIERVTNLNSSHQLKKSTRQPDGNMTVRTNNEANDNASYLSKSKSIKNLKSLNNIDINSIKAKSTASLERTKSVKSIPMSRSKHEKLEYELSFIDPILLKSWNKKLGILFFGSDFSDEVKDKIQFYIHEMKKQLQCNSLVDQTVSSVSDNIILKLDRNYKKLIESIANFWEHQATFLNTISLKLCDFYSKLNTFLINYQKSVNDVREKSADLMWDNKEDFRVESEDREQYLLNLFLKLRQSVNQDELSENFHTVLDYLMEIENSYRDYHAKACFSADKLPLQLICTFHENFQKLSSLFHLCPHPNHAIGIAYDSILENTKRLNRDFFADDPNAAGVEPRKIVAKPSVQSKREQLKSATKSRPQSAAVAQHTELNADTLGNDLNSSSIASFDSSIDNTIDKPKSPSSNPAKSPASGNSPMVSPRQKLKVKNIVLEEYVSPILRAQNPEFLTSLNEKINPRKASSIARKSDSSNFDLDPVFYDNASASNAYCGKFQVNMTIENIVAGFLDERLSVDDDNSPMEADTQDLMNAFDNMAVQPPVLENYPFILSDYVTNVDEILLSEAQLQRMADESPESMEQYEERITEAFLPLSQEQIDSLSDENLSVYKKFLSIHNKIKFQREQLKDPVYLRKNPPMMNENTPWVLVLEFNKKDLEFALHSIRDSLISMIETESYQQLENAIEITNGRKEELTDELEERLRTHAPRRGKVETTIKQPREAELISHQEKTWRHIHHIVNRMKDVQTKFLATEENGQKCCQKYVDNMGKMKSSLIQTKFNNLASLQAVELNGRTLTASFQTESTAIINQLNRICDEDIPAVISFAREFRKLCPLQGSTIQLEDRSESGGHEEGGYSESELAEIDSLVNSQCIEIEEVTKEWRDHIQRLMQLQEGSLKSSDDFHKQYDTVSHELALSEGLGKIYGAPRRRAQERLRTEVSRDEAKASRVDELLTKLEHEISKSENRAISFPFSRFYDPLCNEEFLMSENLTSSKRIDLTPANDTNDDGQQHFVLASELFSLLIEIRSAFTARSEYLDVVGQAVPQPLLSWPEHLNINMERTKSEENSPNSKANLKADTDTVTKQRDVIMTNDITQQTKSLGHETGTIIHIFDEVDATCGRETRELYQKENRLEVLGEGGLPESLEQWLKDNKEKVIGLTGYRVKAWKKLWAQAERLELILARKGHQVKAKDLNNEDEDSADEAIADAVGFEKGKISSYIYRLGLPAVCLRYMTEGYVLSLRKYLVDNEQKFAPCIKVWRIAREKNDRALRPRLADADAVEELNALDNLERERMEEMITNLKNFRSSMIKKHVEVSKKYFEDLVDAMKSLFDYIDSSMRQEILQVPPDTVIPKKRLIQLRMTLKRMRKAQRLREEVAKAQQVKVNIEPVVSTKKGQPIVAPESAITTPSTTRKWPSIVLKPFLDCVLAIEDLIPELSAEVIKNPFAVIKSIQTLKKSVKSQGVGRKGSMSKEESSANIPSGDESDASVARPSSKKGKKEVNTKSIRSKEPSTRVADAETELQLDRSVFEPHLIEEAWVTKIVQSSSVESSISSAHRALIQERDIMVREYVQCLTFLFQVLRNKYGEILKQELSWKERWTRQVELLRNEKK